MQLNPSSPKPTAAESGGPELAARSVQTLFERHHALVFQAAYRITGSATDAEDVLQTVFLRLLRRTGEVKLDPSPEAYLHRAAVNAGLDLLRARARTRAVPVVDTLEWQGVGPEHAAQSVQLRDWLRRAVAELNPRAAEIFTLRYLEGLSNPQIAAVLGTSQAVIAVTLHRTRSRLRKAIRPFLGDVR